MTPAEVIVTIGGVALIALVNWWFFRRVEGQRSKVEPSTSTFDLRPSTSDHDRH